MRASLFDFSPQGWGRIWAGTAIGTIVCIGVAFAIDSYTPATGTWAWGARPINNVIIPAVLGIPLFGYLLAKQRQLAIAHNELMVLASTDALTSCFNRHAFMTLVERYLDRMEDQKTGAQAALLVIDIDHFKQINDTYGHESGDLALSSVASAIKASVREFDVVGRIGGEEFGVLLPGASQDRAAIIAERIRTNVFETELHLAGEMRKVSVSVGGVAFTTDRNASELLRIADQRLYAAKRAGRNRVLMQQLASTQSMSLH